MPQIDKLARQAWQLKENGHSIDAIADTMGKPTSTIERWIHQWSQMASQAGEWHDGLDIQIVACLRHAGIDSREALLNAWRKCEIQRGTPPGIGVCRLVEIQRWIESTGTDVKPARNKAVIVDLNAEAEAALFHIQRRTGQSASQIVCRLLLQSNGMG